ncbi:hypothetical protein ZHAS_00011580 [Anopheles sinensis]|uniref:Uncharacterized protein n=1 Tax=Anopheles sinensis TaxID=74873 RepID=A0A084W093_ANOSI|nr:hypothetical protein ZHAS_00011580 [Anopheles sinensis]
MGSWYLVHNLAGKSYIRHPLVGMVLEEQEPEEQEPEEQEPEEQELVVQGSVHWEGT